MNRRSIELAAGAFLLVGLLALFYLALYVGEVRIGPRDTYRLQAIFTDLTGLKPGSDVRVSGVQVGRVTSVKLDQERYEALLEFEVPSWLRLDDDTIASIRTNGLLGDRFLSLLPGGSGTQLQPGDVIIDTEPVLDLESLIGRTAFGRASQEPAAE